MNKRRYLLGIAVCAVLVACYSDKHELELGQESPSADETRIAAHMIAAIQAISLQRYPSGLIRRFNQSKTLGCFDATFAVVDDLDESLQQGVFASAASYKAQLRFASATKDDDREKDFYGISIKLHGVPSPSLWGNSDEQDFLLNSYPALFAADPDDFLDFIIATRDAQTWRYFIDPRHFYSLRVALKGRRNIDNPFAIDYWSTTPYRFGSDESRAVKYSVRPCSPPIAAVVVAQHKDFLSDAMQKQLDTAEVCFDFMVQFQTDPESMPIENAAVIWDETESPFVTVAKITMQQQATASATTEHCEAMTFNPWQSLAAHQPLGGINRTRRAIYSEIGAWRTQENRQRQAQ